MTRAMHLAAIAHEARLGWGRDYPNNPMIDAPFTLRRSVETALRSFKRTWRLNPNERLAAIAVLFGRLARSYDMPTPTVTHEGALTGDSGSSSYSPTDHHITLRGKLSIITALHEFTHARGYGEVGAVWWSVNAFRLVWCKAFAKLVNVPGTHLMVQRRS